MAEAKKTFSLLSLFPNVNLMMRFLGGAVSLSAITGTTFVEPRRKTFCNTVDFGINRPQRS